MTEEGTALQTWRLTHCGAQQTRVRKHLVDTLPLIRLPEDADTKHMTSLKLMLWLENDGLERKPLVKQIAKMNAR